MKGKLRGMTLVETLIAMLLLGIILGVVLFGSTYLLVWIQNRLVNMPNYVLGMGRLYNAVYINIRDIERSATFTLEGPTTVKYCVWSGDSCNTKSVDLEQLVQAEALGGTLVSGVETATVTVKKPADNRYLLLVYLSVGQKDGRRFDNTVLIKKLVNAAPIPDVEGIQFNGSSANIPLMFPAVGFGETATAVSISPVTGMAYTTTTATDGSVSFIPATALFTLDDHVLVLSATAYRSLQVQLAGTETTATVAYIELPAMIGADGTPVPSSFLKVTVSSP